MKKVDAKRKDRIKRFIEHFFRECIASNEAIKREMVTDIFRSATNDNLERTLTLLCDELFCQGDIQDKYVFSLLMYLLHVDSFMKQHDWYTTTILIEATACVLDKLGYDPPRQPSSFAFSITLLFLLLFRRLFL